MGLLTVPPWAHPHVAYLAPHDPFSTSTSTSSLSTWDRAVHQWPFNELTSAPSLVSRGKVSTSFLDGPVNNDGVLQPLGAQASASSRPPKGDAPCQRWVVADGLAELTRGIRTMRSAKVPWLGGLSSPPLKSLPEDEWRDVSAAQSQLEAVQKRLQMRLYQPEAFPDITALDRRMLRADPARFFASVPAAEVDHMEAAAKLLAAAAERHAARELNDSNVASSPPEHPPDGVFGGLFRDPGSAMAAAKAAAGGDNAEVVEPEDGGLAPVPSSLTVDYPERHRQLLALETLRDLASSTLEAARRCVRVAPTLLAES